MDEFHKSVLLKEVVDFLNPQEGKKYIDATLGGGGHALGILNKGGEVLGIDWDQEAIEHVKERIKNQELGIKNELKLIRGNFREIGKIAHLHGFDKVAGIIFDLGVSSRHFDKAERGFSFQKEGPLDMRMDPSIPVSAKDLVNGLSKGELYELFTKLGEEHRALAISDRIVRARGIKPIETTKDLAKIVKEVYGVQGEGVKGMALANKRIFQALRIAVNDELNNLREALPEALELLERNGRILVISFHSLEDRIIKNTFKDFQEEGLGKIVTKKPITPSEKEIGENRRARSAKLRVFEKN